MPEAQALMYRPQFIYPVSKEPCYDQRCTYSFDGSNTPALVGNLGAGLSLSKIPLLVDTDAPFFLRGFTIPATALQVRLEDCKENPLSDQGNLTAITNYQYPALYSDTAGAGLVTLDSDDWGMYFPAGGSPLLYVYNPTAAPVDMAALFITLHGIKRYVGRTCA